MHLAGRMHGLIYCKGTNSTWLGPCNSAGQQCSKLACCTMEVAGASHTWVREGCQGSPAELRHRHSQDEGHQHILGGGGQVQVGLGLDQLLQRAHHGPRVAQLAGAHQLLAQLHLKGSKQRRQVSPRLKTSRSICAHAAGSM